MSNNNSISPFIDLDTFKERIFKKYHTEYFEAEASKPKKGITKFANNVRAFVFKKTKWGMQGSLMAAGATLIASIGAVVSMPVIVPMVLVTGMGLGAFVAMGSDIVIRIKSDRKVNKDIENGKLLDRYLEEDVAPLSEGLAKELHQCFVEGLRESFQEKASLSHKQRVYQPKATAHVKSSPKQKN